MKWLLHIGTTKTGSKAIQQFLATDADTVVNPRVAYPKAGRSGIWHEDLFHSIESGRTDLLESAREEGLSSQADYAVLSYEGFYELPPESISLIRQTLGEAGILLFIRRQDSHANSWYNQLIKAHRMPISAIEDFERDATAYDLALDHWVTIEKWSAVFGCDAIHPAIYDKSKSSVDVLLEVLQARSPEGRSAVRNPNPALTPWLASVLRGIKELIGESPALAQVVEVFHRRHLSEFMDSYGGETAYLLGPPVRRAIMDHYAASNERVRERYFPELETLFAPLPHGSDASLDLAQGREEARRFLREHFPASLPGGDR